MTWEPTSVLVEEWGYVQIMVNNTDVTFFRDVPTLITTLTLGEPFGPLALVLEFPQITQLEPIPAWLQNYSNVEVYEVEVDGETAGVTRRGAQPLWEGMYIEPSDGDNFTQSGLILTCVGSLLQGDNYLTQPAVTPETDDLGHMIANRVNTLVRDYAFRVGSMERVTTGILGRNRGSWNPTMTGYIQDMLAVATVDAPLGVDRSQWTLMLDPGRRPVLRIKDRTTVNWTVMCAAPGINVRLRQDLLEAPTTIFGEGIAPDNCHWRNTRYPYLRQDDAPLFTGSPFTTGASGSRITQFKNQLKSAGWPMSSGSTFTANDEAQTRRFQASAGIQVDGDVGPQTWAAAFETGSSGGDLHGAYFGPLAWDVALEPFIYDAYGAPIGKNPDFNPYAVPYRIRIERFENYGDQTDFAQGIVYARDALGRDYPAQWSGTIVLTADPQEGSRFDIRPGGNIKVRQHRGVDRLLHIAGVDLDFSSLTVTLTVDERGRDLLTLNQIAKRNRDASDPTRRPTDYRRRSRQVEDRIAVWDCEAGAGIVPRHATYNKLWNVLRIPVAQYGEIVRSRFWLDTPARLSVGVFNRHTSHTELSRWGSPLDSGYWDQFDDTTGLIVALGGDGQMGGYYPNRESDEPTPALTGVVQDDASWNYETLTPPWLWVAIWVESPTINYCEGKFFPGLRAD